MIRTPETGTFNLLRRSLVVASAVCASVGAGHANGTVSAQEGVSLPGNSSFDFDPKVTPGSYLIGNVTAINTSPGGGYAAVYGGEYMGTSTLNTFGNSVLANMFIADQGTDGRIGVQLGGASTRQIVVDSVAELKKNSFTTVLESPQRILDTRQTGPDIVQNGTVKVNVGKVYAGKFAIINLTVDGNNGPGWQATYPCEDGYQGTSSINVMGAGGAQALMNLVKVDNNGDVCVRSSNEAHGTIVDLLGFIDSEAAPFRRILDTRSMGGRSQPGVEKSIVVGDPNSIFVGTIVSTGPSKAGWVAAYTNSGGYNGTSTLNSDGVNSVANLVIMKTDGSGAIQLLSMPLETDIVIDGTTIPELKPYLISDSERLVDSRTMPTSATSITPRIPYVPGAVTAEQIKFKCYNKSQTISPTITAWLRRYLLQISGLNPDTNPSLSISTGDLIGTEVQVTRSSGVTSGYGSSSRADADGKVYSNSGSAEIEADSYFFDPDKTILVVNRTLPSGVVVTSKFAIYASCTTDTGVTKI